MARRLPPLNALKAFESAARHRSFTLAAAELRVTQSAVSRHVKTLEAALGVALFHRSNRHLSLTAEGESLLPDLCDAFDRIARAATRVAQSQRDLRLKVLPAFAIRWLIPRLARFAGLQPDIRVRITPLLPGLDHDMDEFDAWILYGDGKWPNMRADLVRREQLVAVCSPALQTGHHPLRAPDDLAHHQLLHASRDHVEWRSWAKAAGEVRFDPDRGLEFDFLEHTLQAAIRGYGVALLDSLLVADDVNNGRLVVPFETRMPSLGSYYFVTQSYAAEQPKIVAFREWLLAEARKGRNGSTRRR